MHWLNEPPSWQIDGDAITVDVAPGTDFWRRTHYGFIRDSGHFGFETIHGDFVATVKVVGDYRDLYDQAGMMVRIDAHHWIKCGIEYVHGVQYASAVVTREFSDWAVTPLAGSPPAIWLRLTRQAETVEIQYALDGVNFTLLRLAYLPPTDTVQAGVMCAAPDGRGFSVVFENLTIAPLPGQE